MLDYLKTDFNPKANPLSVVQVGPVRFTVLTSKLIRLEYDPTQQFEDRPSQVFWHREFQVPEYSRSVNESTITIETDCLILKYDIQEAGFYHRFLAIELKNDAITWRYGQQNNTNLQGTVRTLDRVDGATPLNPGLLSRNGWSVIDDSQSLVFNQQGWLEKRNAPIGYQDLYFFGYGRNFTECIVDFQASSGPIPILPRFALGNWWSRYWEYHQDDLIELMEGFRLRDIPLSVCIVDMDWHITDTGNKSSGWTGYTWNPQLFPNPEKFINQLHELGLKTALNLHPASGIYPHESQYAEMAKRLDIDPSDSQPIPFDIANPEFTKAYFEVLHHPIEEIGMDFWWLDWQQGTKTTVEGLDPLFWLNHLHFYDLARDGKKRPFIFSRWGGLGSQRYPIGFSGDTFISWDTLQFQPYFTATAANVGYGWWSHDIGGHMAGTGDAELYLRWVQYGVFSPIFRLHSTKNQFINHTPWHYDAHTENLTADSMRLRHRLIPYLYTAAWRNYQEGLLPIRPMYHVYPDENNAYICPNEYTFGSELIAIPFTSPRDNETRLSRQVVWLPEGDWFDFFSGVHYPGGGWYPIYGGLEDIPVFAKAGAIVPLSAEGNWGDIDLPDVITIQIFPGADNAFQLYEDDGESQAYLSGEHAITTFALSHEEDQIVFKIQPVDGEIHLLPPNRVYDLIFYALQKPEEVLILIDSSQQKLEWYYDSTSNQLVIPNIQLPYNAELSIVVSRKEGLVCRDKNLFEKLYRLLYNFALISSVKQSIYEQLDEIIQNPFILKYFADNMKDSQILAMVETWLGKQDEMISNNHEEAFQRIIDLIYNSG